MLSTVESRYAILKGLLAEVEVSTKDSEKLWFTSRVSNTISDLRNVYGFRIVTISKKTATGKRYGVMLWPIHMTAKTLSVFVDCWMSSKRNF